MPPALAKFLMSILAPLIDMIIDRLIARFTDTVEVSKRNEDFIKAWGANVSPGSVWVQGGEDDVSNAGRGSGERQADQESSSDSDG